MVKRIALFNHKGGVSKTTTTFNLGWMLASKGNRVILVDTDPQANLTGLVLGYNGFDDEDNEIVRFYEDSADQNLKSGLQPAFDSSPFPMKAVECYPVPNLTGLFLLPSHIGLSEYELSLGMAQELSGSIQSLQNLPGAISNLLEKTANHHDADYILIDMNPSLSSFNQNLLMTSDYFIVPTNPDSFSVMAIDSLSTVLLRWHRWSKRASSLEILKEAAYPFPEITPMFLGTVIQNYRPRRGSPANNFQLWIDRINERVHSQLIPALKESEMLFPHDVYVQYDIKEYCLAKIPDFNSLVAKSQETRTPVFALTETQIGQSGAVLDQTISSRDNFKDIFSEFADKIIQITGS